MNPPAEKPVRVPRVGRAERPVRMLVAASILVPLAIFIIGATISYFEHRREAVIRLQRTVGAVHEHAIKVFETFDLAAHYTDILIDEPDDVIRKNEENYHARLRTIAKAMPQLRDIAVIDADGKPLVSGMIFPMPRDLDLSNRSYFNTLRDQPERKVYVSQVIEGAIRGFRFFSLAKRRATNGNAFNGVMSISARPDYFVQFYSTLPGDDVESIALIRSDGFILAHYPVADREGFPEAGPLMRALSSSPSGIVQTLSPVDGAERIFSFRRIEDLDVLIVVGIETATITKLWIETMSQHLAFGLPATASLIALSFFALARTRREAMAHEILQEEVSRRQQTEKALQQAQKMEAVGRLTGGIAHDFNNLLTSILGNIDLALRSAQNQNNDANLTRLLTSARHASERAAALVQRLLAFSRQHPQEVKAVNLNRLVQGMSDLLRRTIDETIDVETVLGGGLWKIAVDPNQLENAIINLALNSRDAMPNGGRLTIETANSYLDESYVNRHASDIKPGQYVLLAVSDSGTGMTRDVVERAFEPFFTTKAAGAGSGLGLSMVYGFVKQSGGHIKIYSEVAEGTSIKIYLPRLDQADTVVDWQPATEPALGENLKTSRNETILLVEDDSEVNSFVGEVLSDQGYRVLSAADAATALSLFEADPAVALLFTDVVLPGGMNGRQLAEECLRRRPDLKVLYATGYTRNAIIHQGRLDADLDLLTKPFTPDQLTRKIRQILGRPAAPRV